ncbi:MAG: FRG domain-containing protein [Alphaproteobacteria bacterium]|nr:FRG domain-containing protein [Alphaproteobacteria bacterium]
MAATASPSSPDSDDIDSPPDRNFTSVLEAAENRRVSLTLSEARALATQVGIAKPLFRGEPGSYKTTFSAHHRLFQGPRFTQAQKEETAERLVWIAQTLEVILQDVRVYADPVLAAENPRPPSPDKIHEVIYGFLQHYHLATPFIDVTRNIDVACSFCVSEELYVEPRAARLYVIDSDRLETCGLRVTGGYETRARRPRVQEALSIYLAHACDFQAAARAALPLVLDVEVTEAERRKFYRADLYDASDDGVAHQVAILVHRCAYGDWAIVDPSLGCVSEYFAGVLRQLLAAGVPAFGGRTIAT